MLQICFGCLLLQTLPWIWEFLNQKVSLQKIEEIVKNRDVFLKGFVRRVHSVQHCMRLVLSVYKHTHTHVCFCRDEQCPCRWLIGETKPKYGSKARNKPTTALIQNQRVFALYANRVNELLQQQYFCRHRNIFNDRFLTESEILVCVCYTCLKFSIFQNGSQTYKDTHWSQWSH